MFSGFTGWHALVLLVIVVLLFGATKLPGLAKSVGQSMKIFKNEIKGSEDAAAAPVTPQANTAQAPTAQAPSVQAPSVQAPSAPAVQLNESSDEVRAQTEAAKHNTP